MRSVVRRWQLRFLILTLLLPVTGPAIAVANHDHFNQYDAVENDHIWYDDRMDDYHNALKYAKRNWGDLGSVDIRPVPSGRTPTLIVRTYNSNDGLCGQVPQRSGVLDLWANHRNIDNGSCGNHAPRTVFLHEMGHGLRIFDHTTTSNWYDVMYVFMVRHDQYGNVWECPLDLQNHDIHDYRTWWG